jgi:fumarylacetoacetase
MRSFLPVPAGSHFPIQNLPLGMFHKPGEGVAHAGVAIGEHILDLRVLEDLGLLLPQARLFGGASLNLFLAAGKLVWGEVRKRVQQLLSEDEPTLRDDAETLAKVLVPQREVRMLLPCEIGDYTDFYCSRDHATNVGTMLRGPADALNPNWLHLPVGYHGRASSIVVSGTQVRRPKGQTKPANAETPIFGPSRSLDFELEVAAVVGPGNQLGLPIPISEAEDHLFGLVLLNDWSARDIQAWEYVPLGPFLAKNFCTTISPWIVPLTALEPFRCASTEQVPTPLPYLQQTGPGGFNITLEVTLNGHRITASNLRHLYWSFGQMVAHHTCGGCNLKPGDLLASGTVSGPTPESRACLLELTWRGSQPLALPDGTTRTFLQDGDTLTLTGYAQGDGYRVGFGTCSGEVLPCT